MPMRSSDQMPYLVQLNPKHRLEEKGLIKMSHICGVEKPTGPGHLLAASSGKPKHLHHHAEVPIKCRRNQHVF